MTEFEDQFSKMVSALIKPATDIVNELNDRDAALLHAVIGIASEAGELLDAIKKHVIYRKDLDFDNTVEELGDLEFYMENLRQILGVSRNMTLQQNMCKLQQRYAAMVYSDQAAQDRADKNQ